MFAKTGGLGINREDELGREFRQMLAREETVSLWQIIQQHRASNFEEQ